MRTASGHTAFAAQVIAARGLLSQEEFALKVGISLRQLRRYEIEGERPRNRRIVRALIERGGLHASAFDYLLGGAAA